MHDYFRSEGPEKCVDNYIGPVKSVRNNSGLKMTAERMSRRERGERWGAGENGGAGEGGSAQGRESTHRLPSGSISYRGPLLLLAAKAFRTPHEILRISSHLLFWHQEAASSHPQAIFKQYTVLLREPRNPSLKLRSSLRFWKNQFSCGLYPFIYKMGKNHKTVQLCALKAASTWAIQIVMTHLLGLPILYVCRHAINT